MTVFFDTLLGKYEKIKTTDIFRRNVRSYLSLFSLSLGSLNPFILSSYISTIGVNSRNEIGVRSSFFTYVKNEDLTPMFVRVRSEN